MSVPLYEIHNAELLTSGGERASIGVRAVVARGEDRGCAIDADRVLHCDVTVRYANGDVSQMMASKVLAIAGPTRWWRRRHERFLIVQLMSGNPLLARWYER